MTATQKETRDVATKKPAKTKLTHLEVQNLFFKEGSKAVVDIIEEELASSHTLRRALRELEQSSRAEEAKKFRDVLQEKGFLSQAYAKPDVGDERSYKIQEESGRQVLKVPVDFLGQKAGEEIKVTFTVNGFRATRTN